jgi:hypothetical protein
MLLTSEPTGTQSNREPISVRFARFDAAHPEVYAELRRLALDKVREGATRLGIKALWEEARWSLDLSVTDGRYRLNNDMTASYSRKLMANEPELADVFEVRRRRSA